MINSPFLPLDSFCDPEPPTTPSTPLPSILTPKLRTTPDILIDNIHRINCVIYTKLFDFRVPLKTFD